jgi:hypothetical protein
MKVYPFHDCPSLGASADAHDVGQPRDDADILVYMIKERFDIDGDLLGQQKLLFVELVGHLVPERLVKDLSDYDDEGEDEKERKDDDERRKDFAVLQVAKHTEHALIYCHLRLMSRV